MPFEPVYTKTVISAEITVSTPIESSPPTGYTWVVTDVDAQFSSGASANQLEVIGDFQDWIYWPQPHGMSRQWQWRGRRAILENLLCQISGPIGGLAVITVTAYELTTS